MQLFDYFLFFVVFLLSTSVVNADDLDPIDDPNEDYTVTGRLMLDVIEDIPFANETVYLFNGPPRTSGRNYDDGVFVSSNDTDEFGNFTITGWINDVLSGYTVNLRLVFLYSGKRCFVSLPNTQIEESHIIELPDYEVTTCLRLLQ
uniref:Carboxypeptidase regulatory-like domain-containing protein n=1 Tax=Panagrellus redivivus TaxID=6233 RepID=A0A7E4VMH7_PANRE